MVVGCDFDFTPEWSLYGEDLSGGEMSQSIYAEYNWKSLNASIVWHCPFNKGQKTLWNGGYDDGMVK